MEKASGEKKYEIKSNISEKRCDAMRGWCVRASAVDSVDKIRRMPGVARRGICLNVLYDAIVLQHEMTHRHTLT